MDKTNQILAGYSFSQTNLFNFSLKRFVWNILYISLYCSNATKEVINYSRSKENWSRPAINDRLVQLFFQLASITHPTHTRMNYKNYNKPSTFILVSYNSESVTLKQCIFNQILSGNITERFLSQKPWLKFPDRRAFAVYAMSLALFKKLNNLHKQNKCQVLSEKLK